MKYEREINWIKKEKGKVSKNDIERLEKGEPVDYIIGFVDFLGRKIDLSKRPLIPRPETEYWVNNFIKESGILNLESRILDMFSGSGCIGIAILKNIKNARVDFADADKKYLEQIKINLELNKIEKNKYRIIKSNIFLNIKAKYNFILANPPYLAKRKIKRVGESVLKFESSKALFGGDDGLFFIRKFLKDAKNFLEQEAKIYMEFDSWQKPAIEIILKKNSYKNFEFQKDQYGKWRYVIIIFTF